MRITGLSLLICLLITQINFAQVAVSNTGSPPHASAMLDITSTNKGVLIPRLTTAQRNTLAGTAAKGLLVYDSVRQFFYFHDGAGWVQLTDETTNYWSKNGNNIYSSNAGNVGIGINPGFLKLDVKSVGDGHIARFDGGNQTYVSIYETSNYRGYIGSIAGNDEDVDIGTGSVNNTGKLHFTIQHVPKVTIDTDGDLGIGTTTPGFPLTVVSNDDEGIGLYRNAVFSGALRPTDSTMKIHARYGSSSASTLAADLILQPPSGVVLFNLTGKIGMFTNDPKSDLHIKGDILVGDSDPATGYALSVDGKIISEEVRVQLSGTWPDYVFSKNYKLKSIPQLEQFIKKHRHLPNIPSAKEMEKGQDLGEIQRKMMEKIEELTLYIIQLEKKNDSLEKRLQLIERSKKEQ